MGCLFIVFHTADELNDSLSTQKRRHKDAVRLWHWWFILLEPNERSLKLFFFIRIILGQRLIVLLRDLQLGRLVNESDNVLVHRKPPVAMVISIGRCEGLRSLQSSPGHRPDWLIGNKLALQSPGNL